MISNTTERLFIEYSNKFLQKKMVFPHVSSFTLIFGPFSCQINVFFGLIFMEEIVIFSNARPILDLMLCNWNLIKFDILTLLSSYCRA